MYNVTEKGHKIHLQKRIKSQYMPIPTPTSTEPKDEFLVRCMSDETMVAEYTDSTQRYAVCINTYKENK